MEPPPAAAGAPSWRAALVTSGRTTSPGPPSCGTTASAGVEAQILRDGELVIGRRFDLRELAARWADEMRQAVERRLHDE